MFSIIYDVLGSVILNILQLLTGCFFLFLFIRYNDRKINRLGDFSGLFRILLCSFAGMLLPVNTYGILPVVIGLYVYGYGLPVVIPVLISNFIFNMSVPYTEMNFVWEPNIIRIATAFLAGVLSGIILKLIKTSPRQIIREKSIHELIDKQRKLPEFIRLFISHIESMGLYIICGAIINTLFHRYLFYFLLKQLYSSQLGSNAIDVFMGFDITNSMFVAAGQIINRLMDLSALTAMFFLLKVKSILGVYIFFSIITGLLIVPIFF